jgi:hypothetical protein
LKSDFRLLIRQGRTAHGTMSGNAMGYAIVQGKSGERHPVISD